MMPPDPGKYYNKDIKEDVVLLKEGFHRITFQYGLRPNSLIFSGDDGILIIDPGQRPFVNRLIEIINNICDGNVKYLVNTHPHGDHISANAGFSKQIPIIAFVDLQYYMSTKLLSLKANPFNKKKARFFNKAYTFKFNQTPIQFIPAEGIHTKEDMLVFFPEHKIVHMGDLLLTQSFPAITSKVDEYRNLLEAAINTFPEDTIYVGGHGFELDRYSLMEYKEMLDETVRVIKKKAKRGKTINEMVQEGILDPWSEYGDFISFITIEFWIKSVVDDLNLKKRILF